MLTSTLYLLDLDKSLTSPPGDRDYDSDSSIDDIMPLRSLVVATSPPIVSLSDILHLSVPLHTTIPSLHSIVNDIGNS